MMRDPFGLEPDGFKNQLTDLEWQSGGEQEEASPIKKGSEYSERVKKETIRANKIAWNQQMRNRDAADKAGAGPKDWFGQLGGMFENNYNGGVAYDGSAWYGTNFIGPGPSSDPYKLKNPKNPSQYLKPKDMVDAAAQRHDYYYYLSHADGVSGALFSTKVALADQIRAAEASRAFFGYFQGKIDPITGTVISPRTRDVAFDIMISFGLIGGLKSKFR